MHRARKRAGILHAALGISRICLLGQTLTPQSASVAGTATPIEHLVVIFQENVSFDHYFATSRWH